MSQIKKKIIKNIQNKVIQFPHNINQMLQIQQSAPSKAPSDLNNIAEVTQQHETNRYDTDSIQVQELIKKTKKNWCQRVTECIKSILPCYNKQSEFSITVKEQQILKTIQKLRAENITQKPFLPPLLSDKKTLVLDIDQTLVFSSQNQMQKYDFTFTMPYKKKVIRVYTKIRFGLQSFLFEMSKLYEIIVYTTNIRQYADNVLKNIDKKKRVSHVLYKQKCLNLNKVHFLKSLKAIGRNQDHTIFIDHNVASGILQPKNFLHIKSFIGEKNDRELIKLIPFLRELAGKECVIPVNKNLQQYCNRQIRLKFNSIDNSNNENQQNKQNQQEQKRSLYEPKSFKTRKIHKKVISQLKTLIKENQQEKQMDQQKVQTQLAFRNRDLNLQH